MACEAMGYSRSPTLIASHMGGTPRVDDGALPQEALCDYVRVFIKPTQAASPGSP